MHIIFCICGLSNLHALDVAAEEPTLSRQSARTGATPKSPILRCESITERSDSIVAVRPSIPYRSVTIWVLDPAFLIAYHRRSYLTIVIFHEISRILLC